MARNAVENLGVYLAIGVKFLKYSFNEFPPDLAALPFQEKDSDTQSI